MTNTAKITDRFLAYLIDIAPFIFGYHVSLYFLAQRGIDLSSASTGWGRVLGFWLGLYVVYHAFFNLTGGSIGKRLLGLRVVGFDGEPLGLVPSFVRAMGLLISTPLFNLGFLWAFLSPESRTWHDLMAGSRVIEARPKPPATSAANALLSLMVFAGTLGLSWWINSIRPLPSDIEAIAKARSGLQVLAQIETKYKAQHGTYTSSLTDLAEASGDFDQFRSAMYDLFDADRFQILASRDRFILRTYAKDRRKTAVSISGP